MDVAEKKRTVIGFLHKCNAYADDMISGYQQDLRDKSGMEYLQIQDKINHWSAYRAFNQHAIDELKSDILDDWFTE